MLIYFPFIFKKIQNLHQDYPKPEDKLVKYIKYVSNTKLVTTRNRRATTS